MRQIIAAAAMSAFLVGCSQQTADQAATTPPPSPAPAPVPAVAVDPALTGFVHDKGADLFGYYYPSREVKVGNYKLDHLHIAGEMGFGEWESGARTRTFGPVMLEFVDVTSPTRTNALGAQVYSVTIRVLPTAYLVEPGRIRFVGTEPHLGEVRLDLALDTAALNRARKNANKANSPVEVVLKGGLQVGTNPFADLGWNWFGGD